MTGKEGAVRDALEERVAELELQSALQNDLLDSLSATVARLQQESDLQQAQLRLLYRRLQERGAAEDGAAGFDAAAEVPPHY